MVFGLLGQSSSIFAINQENKIMRRFKPIVTILLGAVFAMPLLVNAAEFTGQVVGHSCANDAKLCPLEGLEAHLAMEPDFACCSLLTEALIYS